LLYVVSVSLVCPCDVRAGRVPDVGDCCM